MQLKTNEYGMFYQSNIDFDKMNNKYDADYLIRNSKTNIEMAYLRLGILLGYVSYDFLRKARILELGPGNGILMANWYSKGIKVEGFDIVESLYTTINENTVYNTKWDILLAFDVIEHFIDIDDLWKINFEYGFFSVPYPPRDGIKPGWRHYRPNEHIWYFDDVAFEKWINANDYILLYKGTPEDVIRERWDLNQPNIMSYIIRKK